MSLGISSISQALDDAIQAVVNAGGHVVVAAGNSGMDACESSPARAPGAITVGATDSSDRLASFSNWGACVDIQAPGVGIRSAWYTDDSATASLSGTSMAAPHTAGVVALYLARNPTISPARLQMEIKITSSANALNLIGRARTLNTQLYSLF